MDKKKKIIILGLVMIMIGISAFLVNEHFSHSEKKDASNRVIEEIQGTILHISSAEITIVDEQQRGHSFEWSKNIQKDEEAYYPNDIVKITYSFVDDTNKSVSIIKKIELIKRHDIALDIKEMIDGMSIEEKVAQMFMVRCPSDGAIEALQQYQMGGYIVFDNVIQPYTPEQFKANNETFQTLSSHGVFIGIDEEGGIVNRLSRYDNYRSVPFLSPQDLFLQGGFPLIQSDTKEKAELLLSYGVNMNFAPVSDLSIDPNDFINERAFGKSAEETAQYVATVVQQMKESNIASVLKHFPGYGNNVDTHTGSAYDNRDLDTFYNNDFIPFERGIESGANVVLVSHNVIQNIDANYPASLSEHVHQILRNNLMFSGIVITDDLLMDAISKTYGDEESAILAIQAGNDMIISSNYEVQINSVVNAVKEGQISETQIDASLMRIFSLKQQLGILK